MKYFALVLLVLRLDVTPTLASVIQPGSVPLGYRRLGRYIVPKNDNDYDDYNYHHFPRRYNYKPIPSPPLEPCQQLQRDWKWSSILDHEPYKDQRLRVTLLWDEAEKEGHAAAALLRATLIAAGYASEAVKIYPRNTKDAYTFKHNSLVVEVTLAAMLQVSLTPIAAAKPICRNASLSTEFFNEENLLQICQFQVPGTQNTDNILVYVLNEWERTCAAETIRQFARESFNSIDIVYFDRFHLKYLINKSQRSFYFLDVSHWSYLPGVHVTQVPNIMATLENCEFNTSKTVSLKVDDFSPELSRTFDLFSPNLTDLHQVIELSKQNYSMEEAACEWARQQKVKRDKFNVWRKAAVVKPVSQMVAVIICKTEVSDLSEYIYLKWLVETHTYNNNYKQWTDRVQFQIFYIDCLETDWLFRKLLSWFNSNVVSQVGGIIVTEEVAIAAAPLANKFQLPLITYDVVSSEHNFRSATGRLKHLELALRRLLVDCDWRRFAIVSEETQLAAALSAKLRSTSGGLAVREVNLTSSTDTNSLKRDLENLLTARARVFVVNTGAATAASVLAIAKELNITWHNGFTWIVREYDAADNATAAIRPYSVSFWWRGNEENETAPSDVSQFKRATESKMMSEMEESDQVYNNNNNNNKFIYLQEHTNNDSSESPDYSYTHYDESKETETDLENDDDPNSEEYDSSDSEETNVALQKKMEKRWRGRAWPLYAAPLLDAFLTLEQGLDRLELYKDKWFNSHRDGSLRMFWNGVQEKKISGLLEDLSYDEYGVSAALVFVQQWGAKPRPRLLATWRSGEEREPDETCPAIDPYDDGSIKCFIPAGDPFLPSCKDAIWITSILFAVIVTVSLFVLAIHRSRQALIARDQRVKTKYAKRLLERRERVFAALAEHLVERSELELMQELGKGRFGRVHLGILRESGRNCRKVVVAAKALREEAAPAEESEFLREACMLAALSHDHVIHFVGVCVVDGPPLLLMEHAFFGDLLQYLQTRRYLSDGTTNAGIDCKNVGLDEKAYVSADALTRLAHEAASALAYIAQRGIVHRDVRASNCLVDERRSLKLADFGLARATGTVDGEYACRRGLFPVLWMAPESLASGVSTVASDVWSFGVLVFELVTLGRRPYGSEPPPSVLRRVLDGGRPQLPWDASAETRALVRACWRRAPETRPTAARLADWLSTRRRALRPALVTELVDIDSNGYGNIDVSDFDLETTGTK